MLRKHGQKPTLWIKMENDGWKDGVWLCTAEEGLLSWQETAIWLFTIRPHVEKDILTTQEKSTKKQIHSGVRGMGPAHTVTLDAEHLVIKEQSRNGLFLLFPGRVTAGYKLIARSERKRLTFKSRRATIRLSPAQFQTRAWCATSQVYFRGTFAVSHLCRWLSAVS